MARKQCGTTTEEDIPALDQARQGLAALLRMGHREQVSRHEFDALIRVVQALLQATDAMHVMDDSQRSVSR